MKHSIIFLVFFAINWACRYDVDENIPNPVAWTEIEGAPGSGKIFLNSQLQGDTLIIFGNWFFMFITPTNRTPRTLFLLPSEQSIYQKNAASSSLHAFASSTNRYIEIMESKHEFCGGGISSCIRLNNFFQNGLLDDLEKFNFDYDIGAFNKNNSFLTSYISKQNPQQMRLFFFKIKPVQYNYDRGVVIDTPSVRYINLPLESTTDVKRIQAIQENFYVSTASNCYLIRADGSFKSIINQSAQAFFEFNNTLYADCGTAIYNSKDRGETWNIAMKNVENTGFRQYSIISGRLVCYHDENKIEEVLLNDSKYTLKPLNTEGVGNRRITSISEYRNKVYLTTLNGILVKPLNRFFY